MSLEELNKRIYDKDFDSRERSHAGSTNDKSQLNPKSSENSNNSETAESSSPSNGSLANPFIKEEQWNKEKEDVKRKKIKNIFIFSFASILLIGLIVGGLKLFIDWRRDAFLEDRVVLEIDGMNQADSGQMMEYKIRYENDNRVALRDAELVIDYTENFQPNDTDNVNLKKVTTSRSRIYVGDIKPNSKGEMVLKGAFYAPKDFPVYLRASLLYNPADYSMKLEKQTQFAVNISTSPIYLEVTTPNESLDGDTVEYVIDYKNLDIRPVRDIRIMAQYPSGYEYEFSDPKASEGDNIWYLGMLEQNQSGQIRIRGKLRGIKDEQKKLVVQIGKPGENGQFVAYNQRERSTEIKIPLVMLTQKVSDLVNMSANSGDVLKFEIGFKNNHNAPVRDLVLSTEIDGKILDFAKLKLNKGSYNENTGVFTWKSSDVPELKQLESGQEERVTFEIPLVDRIPVENPEDKNFTVKAVSTITSIDMINPSRSGNKVTSGEMEIRLNSKVIFGVKGYYNDSVIPNSGPIPPKVGQETSYTLHWSIANISNDLKNVKIVSSLPTGVKWLGKINPENENLKYDEQTNSLIWSIESLPAATGVLSDEKRVAFQVSIVPQSHQVGEAIELLKSSKLTGTDTFTGNEVVIEAKEKTIRLNEDLNLSFESYKVVP